jgi:hypothetical protein
VPQNGRNGKLFDFPLAESDASLTFRRSDLGGIMPKFIRRGLEALRALAELIGEATLPAPKPAKVKVGAGKGRR